MPAAMPGIAGQSALTLRNGSEGSAIRPNPDENVMIITKILIFVMMVIL
jgi:hypothetical protein